MGPVTGVTVIRLGRTWCRCVIVLVKTVLSWVILLRWSFGSIVRTGFVVGKLSVVCVVVWLGLSGKVLVSGRLMKCVLMLRCVQTGGLTGNRYSMWLV